MRTLGKLAITAAAAATMLLAAPAANADESGLIPDINVGSGNGNGNGNDMLQVEGGDVFLSLLAQID